MTVLEARRALTLALAAARIDPAVVEADLLLAALLDMSRAELILNAATTLTAQQAGVLADWQRRRAAREPLQHILGAAHFYGLDLRVNSDVLVPRPETEVLVELALKQLAKLKTPRVLDVGTGSGAVALALKRERPGAVVMASDVSAAALDVTRQNAQDLNLELNLQLSDLLAKPAVQQFAKTADLLVSNPPYLPDSDRARVSPEVARDPVAALYAGADGLDIYKRLTREAYAYLPAGSLYLVELDPRNVEAAYRLAGDWAERYISSDLLGRQRFLGLRR